MMSFPLALLTLAVVSAVSLPEGAKPVLPPEVFQAYKGMPHSLGAVAPVRLTDADSKAHRLDRALRCEIKSEPSNPWSFQFQFPIRSRVEKGDVLLARFRARTVRVDSETGAGTIRPVFEKSGPPHDKSLSQELEIPGQWKEYFMPFKSLAAYDPGKATVGFHLGFQKQTVEIADFAVYSFGRDFDLKRLPRTVMGYKGQEPDAAWRKEAEKRIETIRKGDLKIVVNNAEGKPVPGAEVEVRMKRHAFGWGSAVVAKRLLAEGRDAERYREIVETYFTRVVFENNLKWRHWENTTNREETLRAARWLRDRNIEIRGHCLVWPSWRHVPGDLESLAGKPDALRKRVDEHVRDEVTAMKGLLVDWDVINEPYNNNDIMRILGDKEMVRWFKLAHECDPDVNLYLNDFGILSSGGKDRKHQDHFEKTLKFLKENGAPIKGLGMQSHFGGSATPPERMLEILDRFGRLGLDISITEHDIATEDEEFQAEFTRDFLYATFSHPSVVAVLNWGFWEQSHWKPNAAYFKADWSITPAGRIWIDLVSKTWWTNENGKTDSRGRFTTRGFFGDYELTVRNGGKTKTVDAKLSKKGTTLTVTLP